MYTRAVCGGFGGHRHRKIAGACALLLLATRATSAQSSSATTSTTRWTLESVLRAALDRHPLILAADARVRAARGGRIAAGAFGNPTVTYQVENAGFPGREGPPGSAREASTFATLPLEPLWQRRPRMRRADEDLRIAEAEAAQARRAVALDAARAFHRTALAQATVDAASDVETGLDSLIRYTRARVKEGSTAEGDAIRLEVERDRQGTERALSEAELAQARGALLPYLGPDSTRGDPDPRLAAVTVNADSARSFMALPSAAQLTHQALTLRPDVAIARARARGAGFDVSLQRTLFIRQVGALFGTKNVSGANTMIAGLSLPIPLFDQNRGERQRAEGERTAVERELAWTERRALAEVEGAYEAARVLSQQVQRLRNGFLARAEESRRIAVVAYREGAVPLLQVIDATRALADARVTYLRATFAQQDALLSLYGAAGLDPVAALTPTSAPTGEKTP
ncbi:MAG: TolC family protein [bacterium]